MIIRSARRDQPEPISKGSIIRLQIESMGWMGRFDSIEACSHESSHFVIGEGMRRMRQYRGAARPVNERDGLIHMKNGFGNERRTSICQIQPKRLGHIGDYSPINHRAGNMRPTRHALGHVGERVVERDRMAEFLQPLDHPHDSRLANFVRRASMLRHCLVIRVEPIPEEMDLAPSIAGCYLNAGNELQAKTFGFHARLGDPSHRIMICERRAGEPGGCHSTHDFRRRVHTVRCGGMEMKVVCDHAALQHLPSRDVVEVCFGRVISAII